MLAVVVPIANIVTLAVAMCSRHWFATAVQEFANGTKRASGTGGRRCPPIPAKMTTKCHNRKYVFNLDYNP